MIESYQSLRLFGYWTESKFQHTTETHRTSRLLSANREKKIMRNKKSAQHTFILPFSIKSKVETPAYSRVTSTFGPHPESQHDMDQQANGKSDSHFPYRSFSPNSQTELAGSLGLTSVLIASSQLSGTKLLISATCRSPLDSVVFFLLSLSFHKAHCPSGTKMTCIACPATLTPSHNQHLQIISHYSQYERRI